MYDWKLQANNTTYEGHSRTLHDAIDHMVKYAYGKTERDFFINGHHMNEEFDLWIDDGKVIHDDGTEFVPTNVWYDLLGGVEVSPVCHFIEALAMANIRAAQAFRPQPTRGSAPTNPSTFAAKGDGV